MSGGNTLIPLAGLYENVSQRTGKRYFKGYLACAKLLMLEAKEPEPGEPHWTLSQWTLFIAERPEKPERQE